jgi:hypothetical protein
MKLAFLELVAFIEFHNTYFSLLHFIGKELRALIDSFVGF